MVDLDFDVVVVGGGLAGLMTAIHVRKKQVSVAVVCKTYPNLAHSKAAQGGINAAIAPVDKIEDHFFDTVKGGDYLGDQDKIELLCKNAPNAIEELKEYGVSFNKTPQGSVAQRPFGGQRFARTCFAADKTGHALLHSVYETAQHCGIRFFNECQALSVLKNGGKAVGLAVLQHSTGRLIALRAKAIVFATGGAGRIYSKTTNPDNTGDGIALALQAGCVVQDLEFMQFHPTTLLGSNQLMSEAGRGEGGFLVNSLGERFMSKYAPEKMELAPRDVVARAIQTEINEGRGVGEAKDSVYLDLRHLGREVILSKLPQIRDIALKLAGVDMVDAPVPVQPGQHYTMGGIAANADCSTTVLGLYAVGECSSLSVHGANRLGGNSLLETIVFGKICGESASNYAVKSFFQEIDEKQVDVQQKRVDKLLENREGIRVGDLRKQMGFVMEKHFGVFREEKTMVEGLNQLKELLPKLDSLSLEDESPIFNPYLQEALELQEMALLSQVIALGALSRRESRGAHYRVDYSKRDDQNFLKHTRVFLAGDEFKLEHAPVTITKLQPQERKY